MNAYVDGTQGWVAGPPRPDFVVDDKGCWIWQGAKSPHGYGLVRYQGRGWLAHRWAYTLLREAPPVGAHLHHKCRNSSCINPSHLEALSQTEHNRRYGARLTLSDVEHIRSSTETLQQLAKRFGASPETIYLARKGLTWGARKDKAPDYLRQNAHRKIPVTAYHEIRLARASASTLAKRYGVTIFSISAIRRGTIGPPLSPEEEAAQRCRKATPNPRRKLTDEQIREIRASPESGLKLAPRYGVSFALIYKIKARDAYRDVT